MFLFFAISVFSGPFGIHPSLEDLYKNAINTEDQTFTCLDGSKVIPLSAINDDKCDCPDSSDEPGTSACLNGHFYCHNKGGKGKSIPSHKVNNGVCDCCDGSDEFDNPSVQCPNICEDLVELSNKSRKSIYEKINLGLIKKKESIRETALDLPRVKKELRELSEELNSLDKQLDLLRRKKREKKKVYKAEKRAKEGIDEEEYQEMKRRKKEYINKPKKKKVIPEEEDVHGFDIPFDEVMDNIDWNVDEGIEEQLYYSTPKPKPKRRNERTDDNRADLMRINKRKDKWRRMMKAEEEKRKELENPKGAIVKLLQKAKNIAEKITGLNELKSYKELRSVEKEIEALDHQTGVYRSTKLEYENILKHDLGEDNLWFPLSEKSFEITKDDEDFKLVIFGPILHRQTGTAWFGTCCGQFSGFNKTRRVMYYEDGQLCWEGSPRRTEVYLYCGQSHKFLDIEEVDRCVYRAHFETPLSCDETYIDYIKNMDDVELSEFITRWQNVD